MPSSGSIDYELDAAGIIEHALKEIGVLGAGDTVDSNDQADALVQLNLMVKLDQAKGLKLWRVREGKLFVVKDQVSYSLPGANACDIDELHETTLDAAEASGQTVLSVTATTGFTASDVIGVVQDDDTIHWSTIASFVADDTVTIDDALTGSAASGNKVYVYTTAAPRPLRITSCRRELDDNEIPMFRLSRDEYFDLPNKSTSGVPTQFYYDPQKGVGKLYVWQPASSVDNEINFTYLDSLEDFDATTDTSDYPQEWMSYLISNLAIRLAPQHGKQVSQSTLLWAADSRKALEEWDQEEDSVYFG